MGDRNYLVSARCARALWRLGPKGAGASKALLELLKNPDKDFWEPRACAAVALGSMGVRTKDMVPSLTEALAQTAYADLRAPAARYLGDLGADARPATESLRRAARDRDRDIARAAADALERIGDPG